MEGLSSLVLQLVRIKIGQLLNLYAPILVLQGICEMPVKITNREHFTIF